MPSTLIVYASVEGHTERIAQRIGACLRAAGHSVDVVPAGRALELDRYAGVIVGASVHYGHHPGWLAKWIRSNAERLRGRKAAFYSVSLAAKERYATKFLRKAAGWQPELTAVFPGALQYSRYGPIKRRVVQAFAMVGGHDTYTSRDYDYPDWKAVERFATAFAALVT